eukprot:symbB.v1.2.023585.t1/scaffold2167.1/size87172/12
MHCIFEALRSLMKLLSTWLVRSARKERASKTPVKAETVEDFGVFSSRERKEELLLAVKSIRMRQMSRERTKQMPHRSRSVKSESDVPVVVKSVEDWLTDTTRDATLI